MSTASLVPETRGLSGDDAWQASSDRSGTATLSIASDGARGSHGRAGHRRQPGRQSDVATLLRTLLQLAERHVRIATAYFVPDEDLISRLCQAAERGVSVQILLPGPHADKRFVQLAAEADYERLLECGVELFNFQPSMLHTKITTVDGIAANVGSANLNTRSLSLDDEINLVVIDGDIASALDADFEVDLERSVAIIPGRWQQRSLFQRGGERPIAPLRRLF
jgi:cardiolipin synthase A/B